jgi:serine/threonine protein kinase
MPGSGLLGGRYRIEEPPIGQGGMGVVYKAYDVALKNRLVAVKTIKGPVDDIALEQFRKEWDVLIKLSHPNIVNIFDVGEFGDSEGKKPYLVMQLLRGCHLGELLKANGSRLEPERVVNIMSQVCRGLQEAHKQSVIHRDLKPSNLFVLEDDTVIVIDFGIVHLAGNETGTGLKGTLPYMAPEQLEGKSSPQSDIYSLGVVCYEALTGRKPFDAKSPGELVEAIRSHIPPAISQLNDSVPYSLTQVIHRALAKQPYHRFSSAREFAEILQRALRNEAIPQFDRAKIAPRLSRVRKALGEGECTYAREMLTEIEAEGIIDPEISLLRIQTEKAMRSRTIHQLLESARFLLEGEDYPLALQKVQNVLELEPTNIDALALKAEVERTSDSSQGKKWYDIGRQHLEHQSFSKAREAAEQIRKVDVRLASELLFEIGAREQQHSRLQQERQQLYDSALTAYRNGEISTALSKLEKVIELGKRLSGRAQTDSQYVKLYEEIRSERDELQKSYAEGTKALESKDFNRALAICRDVLSHRPDDKLFRALELQVHDFERQAKSAAIAEIYSRIHAEPDLEKKFQLAKDASNQFPDEQMFAQALKLVRERRDLVNSIVSRARLYESQGQIPEAVNQWDMLRKIYPQHPGLDYELDRLSRKQEDYLRDQARAGWVDKIQRALMTRSFKDADSFIKAAGLEFPDDSELSYLKQRLDEALQKRSQAQTLLEEGQRLAASGDRLAAIQRLHAGRELDETDPAIRAALIAVLGDHARTLIAKEWRAALLFVEEALSLDPADPGTASVSQLIEDAKRREQMDRLFADVRALIANGQQDRAIAKVEQCLREFPEDVTLLQLLNRLKGEFPPMERSAGAAGSVSSVSGPAAPERMSEATTTDPVLEAVPTRAQAVNAPTFNASRVLGAPRAENEPRSFERKSSIEADQQPSSRPAVEPANLAGGEAGGRGFRGPLSIASDKPEHKGGSTSKTSTYVLIALTAVVVLLLTVIGVQALKRSRRTGSPVQNNATATNARGIEEGQNPHTDAGSHRPRHTPTDTTKARLSPPLASKVADPNSPGKDSNLSGAESRRANITVEFESDPAGARVTAEDYKNKNCITPCKLRFPEGIYNVSFSSSGYESKDQVFELPGTDHVGVTLSKKVKTYTVDYSRPNLKVSVDDEDKGLAPGTLQLSVGTHRLKAEGNGFSDTRTITVEDGDSGDGHITLGPGHAPKGDFKPDDSETPATAAK